MRKDLLNNKDWLYKKYWIEGLSSMEIAKICGCSGVTVQNYLKKHNIKRRSNSVAQNVKIKLHLLNNKEWLYKKYWIETLTSKEISILCNCSSTTVYSYLKKHNIKRRSNKESQNPDKKLNLLTNKKWMYKKYIEENLSISKIANFCNCSDKTVTKYLELHNIKIRSLSESHLGIRQTKESKQKISKKLKGKTFSEETKKKRSGKKHYNWKGGISFKPYCKEFNENRKKIVRKEFVGSCFCCGKTKKENNGRCLSVHHVDYNKGQGCGHNWSLIPLCESCHSKTNYNRWYWFNLLQNYWLYKYNLFTLFLS